MNSVNIIGNLTADPILKPVGTTQVCEFSIACNEVFYVGEGQQREKKEVVHFFNAQCWGARGESLAKFFSRGKPIALSGMLKQDRWEKDGQKQSRVYIRVEGWDFCGGDAKKATTAIDGEVEHNDPDWGGNDTPKKAPLQQTVSDDDLPM